MAQPSQYNIGPDLKHWQAEKARFADVGYYTKSTNLDLTSKGTMVWNHWGVASCWSVSYVFVVTSGSHVEMTKFQPPTGHCQHQDVLRSTSAGHSSKPEIQPSLIPVSSSNVWEPTLHEWLGLVSFDNSKLGQHVHNERTHCIRERNYAISNMRPFW